MRRRTLDREADAFFTTEKIGRTQELTPEGYLLCRDVRIARIGEMLYGEGEVPLEVGRDMIIHVTRDAAELFRPETIASVNGKSIVDEHPDEDIGPDNETELSCGVMLHPRAGEGEDAGYLVCDFLVKTRAGIEAVQSGKREISLGYDADYEQTGPGRGRQFNIIVNHGALVDKGRCGPRCAIGDSDMKTRDKKRSWKDRVMTAFKARDEAALTEAMTMADAEMTEDDESEGGEPQTVVIRIEAPAAAAVTETEDEEGEGAAAGGEEAPAWFKSFADDVTKRLTALEAARTGDEERSAERTDPAEKTEDDVTELNPAAADLDEGKTYDEEEGDDKDKDKTKDRARTGDSAPLSASFQDMISRGEILAPGIKMPTFDGKAKRAQTLDRMCAFKRRAVVKALEDEDTRDLLTPLIGKRDPAKLTCDAVATIFTAGSELVKRDNSAITRTGYVHDHAGSGVAKPATISDINQKNRDFWRAKGGAL
jgi:hypothetical protein